MHEMCVVKKGFAADRRLFLTGRVLYDALFSLPRNQFSTSSLANLMTESLQFDGKLDQKCARPCRESRDNLVADNR